MSNPREIWGTRVVRKGGLPNFEIRGCNGAVLTHAGDLYFVEQYSGHPLVGFAAGTWIEFGVIYKDEK